MGRIEEALRRAAAEKAGVEVPAAGQAPGEAETPFSSPWDFERYPLPPAVPAPGASDGLGVRTPPPRTATAGPVMPVTPRTGAPSLRLEQLLAMDWQPFGPELDSKLVLMRRVDPAAVEQYRRLATALLDAQTTRGVRTVLVTSAAAGEGKTLTALNLALTLAHVHGKRVLLVDANLRAPRIHVLLQTSAGAGLAACLGAAAPPSLPVVGLMDTLALLPAGAAGADPGLIASDAMRHLLAGTRGKYDWVVLDGASVNAQPETAGLAAIVDGVVLVVRADETPGRTVSEAVDAIGRERVLGVVLNQASRAAVESA